MMIPLSEPDITEAEISAVVDVLRGTRLSLGPRMEEFEGLVAAYAGVPYGIAVSSGTAGLHLCVRALGIGPGNEVIVPSFTFIAAANAIRYEGAVPVFVDVKADSLNLDPACVERAISARTRAIMVVHTFGCPADMDSIRGVAQRYNLKIIEDACEAIGARYKGQRVGSFGDAAVFAFYPNKQITTGEGGMVVTRDETIAREVRAMRNQGRYPSDSWHQHSILGFNYRLSEINCALGATQMVRIDDILARRRIVANRYGMHLDGIAELILPRDTETDRFASWFVYVVRFASGGGPSMRDRVADSLARDGVQCGRYFAPIHQQPAYSGFLSGQALPVTEAESLRTLALPFFTRMSEEQIAYVAERLRRAILECT